jgi:uncharacterized protein YbjT (DUF2867 family)
VPAIGNLDDAEFLTQTFRGATAVYLMIPPKWDVTDWRAYQRGISEAFLKALRATGVQKAVLLSSEGAHLLEGAGPVSGLARLEHGLREIEGLHVRALRPGFFMENFFGVIGLIKQAGMVGYSLRADIRMPIVHTRDIADLATKRLLDLDFSGHTHEFVGGAADLTMGEATTILGNAIGKPELPYVVFSPEEAKAGMQQAGIPETIADGYNELFDALNTGIYQEGYVRTADNTTPTTLEWFAAHEFKFAFGG